MRTGVLTSQVSLVVMLTLTLASFTVTVSFRGVVPTYGLESEVAAALTQWTIPTPNSLPSGLTLDPSGQCCWFVEALGNKVVHLDPSTDTFQEWAIPTPSSKPTSLALVTVSGSMLVFGTETDVGKVFLFFPSTGMFREYTLPQGFSPRYISIEPEGSQVRAWFTGLGNSIGQVTYDPSLGTLRMIQLPLPAAATGGAKGLRATPGVIWFAAANAILKWETATSRFTTWTVPVHTSAQPAFLDIDELGQVWYASASVQGANYVGVLRSDNTFTEWQIPTTNANGQAISINPTTQNPWIAELGTDKIAKLDPSSGGTVTNAKPVTTKSEPVSEAFFTHVTGPALPSTVTVAPATSTPSMTSGANFAEWTLEAGSGLRGIVVDASGETWTLESSANKVARLSLASNFLVECDPSSLSVVQSANITSTCTVTSVDGFSSTVELSGSWVGATPEGVAYTLPNPVTPPPGRGVSSTLIISAGPRASTGTYTFRVTGTSGPLRHATEIGVTIAAGVADFTIVVSPSYLSIAPGGSGSATITVQSLGVFFSSVQLAGSGTPTGMALLFEPNPVAVPIGGTAQSTVTVNLSGVLQGNYTLTISGSDGSLNRSATLTVEITGGCLIATATYGSELSDEVQLLRNFRDHSILTTKTGSSFMIAFNAWYYSFSPTIAAIIREHSTVRDAAKLALYPLIGILRIGGATYHLLPTDQEASTVITGVVVSSFIGSVYLSLPLAVLFRYSARARRLGRKLTVPLSCALLLALITTALTLTVDAPLLPMMIATSAIVLTSLAVSTLIASIAIARLLTVVQHTLTAARLAGIP